MTRPVFLASMTAVVKHGKVGFSWSVIVYAQLPDGNVIHVQINK